MLFKISTITIVLTENCTIIQVLSSVHGISKYHGCRRSSPTWHRNLTEGYREDLSAHCKKTVPPLSAWNVRCHFV